MSEYFIHIPKTAGSSFRYAAARRIQHFYKIGGWVWMNYLSNATIRERYDKSSRESEILRFGHFTFGYHNEVKDPNPTYYTILRDPIERCISGYYHLKKVKAAPAHKSAIEKSIGEILDSQEVLDFDNGQLRRLSGIGDSVRFGELTEDHLLETIDIIDRFYAFIGFTEQFDLTLLAFQNTLKINGLYYWRQNTTKAEKYVSPEDRKRLFEVNKFDILLYQYCFQKFKNDLEQRSDLVNRFRVGNKMYNSLIYPQKVIKKLRYEIRSKTKSSKNS